MAELKKKILIIEDEADIVNITRFRLQKWGYEVIVATDGKTGIDYAREHRPDLIFLDLGLPVISGHDVCKTIKADPNVQTVPIILFTASTDRIKRELRELQVEDYIVKPFEPEELKSKVEKLCACKHS
ncbi:MAG: response regulator [Elusimicrobia bacterium]|nr:response regulator [Elusimicrobiota bacterium]MBD3412387.1 response regulator [Elusimicrobiota bacterium]